MRNPSLKNTILTLFLMILTSAQGIPAKSIFPVRAMFTSQQTPELESGSNNRTIEMNVRFTSEPVIRLPTKWAVAVSGFSFVTSKISFGIGIKEINAFEFLLEAEMHSGCKANLIMAPVLLANTRKFTFLLLIVQLIFILWT